MPIRPFVDCWFRIVCVPAFLTCCVVPLTGQTAAEQPRPAIDSPPALANAANEQPSCSAIQDATIPTRVTIKAKVTGALEAGRQKTGKKLWLNSVYPMDYPGCRMNAGAPIYGIVTAASSAKSPDSSELSLQFDAADCQGRDKQPMKLVVVGAFAPPDELARGHDSLPMEVHGTRQISEMAGASNGYDANLSPVSPARVSPGSVFGFKNLKLEPQAGPQCSARFTSTSSNLALPPGTVLLLLVRSN